MSRHERRPTSQPVSMAATINMLDSKLRLLAQRIKVIENNVQVMARTIVSHNKQLKELERKLEEGGGAKINKEEILAELKASMPTQVGDTGKLEEEIKALRDDIARLKSRVSELEYVIKSLNTMELVTLDQLKEAIESKLKEIKKEG